MVTQQVLRVPAGVAHTLALLGAIAWLPHAAAASPNLANSSSARERVVLVELRAGDNAKLAKSRAGLTASLESQPGIALRTNPELDAALAGLDYHRAAMDATKALDSARTAFGRLDCKHVDTSTMSAIGVFAGMQAAEAPVAESLRVAYTYRLLCADSAGRRTDAMRAASRLRTLRGPLPPRGIGAAVWARYPEVDAATNVLMARLTITGPHGAKVWVDHTNRGAAPVTVIVARGIHRVALATKADHVSKLIHVTSDSASTNLVPAPRAAVWRQVRARVAAWRRKTSSPSRAGLAALMKDTGVRFAIVITGPQAVVWGVRDSAPVAQRLGVAPIAAPEKLAAIIVDGAREFDGQAPRTAVPLLVGKHGATTPKKQPQKWWVYASIIGAVAVGAGIIISRDLATDRQRIQLSWP